MPATAVSTAGITARTGAHQTRKAPAWIGMTPTPDSGFVRKLKEFDRSLSVEFDRYLGKFVIYQQGKISGKVAALVVQGDEHPVAGFRQPDDRDIDKLRLADLHNDRMRRRILYETEQKMLDVQAKDEKQARDTFREASIDDRHYLKREMRKTINDGKTASHVTPIKPKPKGKAFK